jgi:ABC-type spermidine/putrescine transport system permease subunit I
VGAVQGGAERLTALGVRVPALGRRCLLAAPLVFVAALLLVPLGLMFVASFWERAGFWVRPALSLASYAQFLAGARLTVLQRSLVVATEVTLLGLALAYPIAYFLALRVRRELARSVLLLFTVPFLVNYVIRTFSWVYLLGRTGPVNRALIALGVTDRAVDWLLFSDFAVFVGLISSYMPFMIYPLWAALDGIDRRLVEASWLLGASPPLTFLRVTFPLSMPGVFAAVIFGFVGTFGESAVPIILGGVGYQLMGNTITSALDVLNYPLAAAMSSVVVATMLLFLMGWYLAFDLRAVLGKIVRWRY